MSINYITRLGYTWFLAGETPASQRYLVVIDANKPLSAQVDIHFARSYLARGTICFVGPGADYDRKVFNAILFDLKKILKKHGQHRYRGVFLWIAYVNKTYGGRFIFKKMEGGSK